MAVAKFKKTELTIWQSNHNSEARRAEVGTARVGFETALWERVRGVQNWTKVSTLYDDDARSSRSRRVRRYLSSLARSGFIEILYNQDHFQPGPSYAEFRSRINDSKQ